MRFETVEGKTHIYLDEGEDERQVLRAIARASFELARPGGHGWVHFQGVGDEMDDKAADQFIELEGHAVMQRITRQSLVPCPEFGRSKVVLSMDYVRGRQCKTDVCREGPGHFRLNNRVYEMDRGDPTPMLERAKHLLSGDTSIVAHTEHMYQGRSLDLRLKQYGLSRKTGENDWEFRKRIFPEMFAAHPEVALEFLLGASAAEWSELDRVLVATFLNETDRRPKECTRFARGFAADPIELRQQRMETSPAN